MKKWGITSLLCHKSGFENCLQKAKTCGYGYVELNCVSEYFAHYNAMQLADSPETLAYLKGLFDKYQMQCSAVDCHGLFGRSMTEFQYRCDYLLAGFKVAEALNCPIVATSIPGGSAPWEVLVEKTAELCRIAADRNLEIAVEAEYGFVVANPDDLERFIADVDAPNLKVNFDPSHFARANYNIAESVRRLFPKIAHVHLKEYLPEKSYPTRFEGTTGGPAWQMLDALFELDYQGVVSAETVAELDYHSYDVPDIIMNGIEKWQKNKGFI